MKKIILYLGLTFLVTYLSLFTLSVLINQEIVVLNSFIGQTLYILGGSSPTIITVILIIRYETKAVQESFLKAVFKTDNSIYYWILALFLPLVIGLFFQLSYRMHDATHRLEVDDLIAFFLFFLASIVFGGLEEVGWRGYLLPKLMKKTNLLIATIIVGIIWGLWHLPFFFIEGLPFQDYALIPYLLGAMMFSTYLSIIYVKTKSILLTIFFHASINASASIGLSLIFKNEMIVYAYLLVLIVVGFAVIKALDQDKDEEVKEV